MHRSVPTRIEAAGVMRGRSDNDLRRGTTCHPRSLQGLAHSGGSSGGGSCRRRRKRPDVYIQLGLILGFYKRDLSLRVQTRLNTQSSAQSATCARPSDLSRLSVCLLQST